jgi:hypothetical protein
MYPKKDTSWATCNKAFTEHFYLTYSDLRIVDGVMVNHDEDGVLAMEIGAHRDGQHQHYEEGCGARVQGGDGTFQIGAFKMGHKGCVKHKDFGAPSNGHLFIYYK